jgi:hypothetical protein
MKAPVTHEVKRKREIKAKLKRFGYTHTFLLNLSLERLEDILKETK